MKKAKAKNKQSTFAALIADSQPVRKAVKVGKHTVTIQELDGRARFELGEREETSRWDTMLWMCMAGIVKPKPKALDDLEKIKPEWIVKIATQIMKLSGIDEEQVDDAKNESGTVSDTGGS